jgi:fatty-acyl-CoA synthase
VKAPFARTLFDVVHEQAERRPEALAVIDGALAVTYAELSRSVRRIASALVERGVRRGARIGILAQNRLEWIEVAVAAGAAGAVAVPFSTWSTRQELDFLIRDSGIVMLFASAKFGDRDYAADLASLLPSLAAGTGPAEPYPALRELICFEHPDIRGFAGYAALHASSGEVDLPPGLAANPADDALVLYTSGSSAHPKAVRLLHHGIVENGFNIGERQGYGPDDRVFLSAPLFWSYGSANAMSAALTHGATIVLQDRFEPRRALELIEAHRCSAIYTLPGMTAALLREPGFHRDRVRTLRTGLTIGSPEDVREAVEGLGVSELCNVYGATETYGNCCVTWHHWPLEKRMNCQGPPLPGNELRFVDIETGQPVPKGQPGLTEVRGYVTAGYSGASSDQNEIAFSADRFYRTGDVGRLDEDGHFVFVGRHSEMIKRAGINVSPAEVENVLLLYPGVESAGVVGVPDRERGERVVAYVVAKAGQALTQEELLSHCRTVASKYKVPDSIEITTRLPTTPTGKLQRRELRKIAVEQAQAGEQSRG